MTEARDEALLDRAIADARSAETPSIDWSSAEEGLFARIARGEGPRWSGEPLPAPRARWAEPLAAAAAVALVVGATTFAHESPRQTSAAVTHSLAASDPGRRDGDALRPGDRVDPIGAPALVEHAGRARWVVSAGSHAAVVSAGDHVEIRLDSGRIVAEVTPHPTPGWFSVVAGETRVSVRGTRFSVERDGDRIHVEVVRGRVAVGPARVGAEDRWLLEAPAEMNVALDASKWVDEAPGAALGYSTTLSSGTPSATTIRSNGAQVSSPEPTGVHAVRSPASNAAADRRPSSKPSRADDAELTRLARVIGGCVGASLLGGSEVRVTGGAAMTLLVSPAGLVDEARFDPPLPPDAVGCAEAKIRAARFVPSHDGMRVGRRVSFGR